MAPTLRSAAKEDAAAIQALVNAPSYTHRHLDWRDITAWVGRQPFYLLEEQERVTAAMACIAEPEEVAWLRLFSTTQRSSPDRAWAKLFAPVLDELRAPLSSGQPAPAVVSLALREWFEDLLRRQGFIHHQDIVVFLYDQAPPDPPQIGEQFHLREMTDEDLPAVHQLDRIAFEPIWRLSLDDVRFASSRSAYCTVMEHEGQVVGYTMSSLTPTYAHLARLAIHPAYQGRRLGFTLVQDLLDHFLVQHNAWGVTLNTQHDNHSSLALYHRVGFRETGERFPVYIYPQ